MKKTIFLHVMPWKLSEVEYHGAVVSSQAMRGLLKWQTAVWIWTFGWRRPDLVNVSKVYSTPTSFYPKILHFWLYF